MVRNPYIRLFDDKQKLYLAINLRRIGWATSSLAIILNCDRSSVDHQMWKYKITPEQKVFRIERIASTVLRKHQRNTKWAYIDGERVCLGKSYAEYLSS